MAFLNEAGLSIFKKKCDAAYIKVNGGASTQTITASIATTFGLKTSDSNAVVGQNQSTNIYGPCLQMYDKNGTQCGQLMHGFRTGSTNASCMALYAQNKMSDGTAKSGGLSVYRSYNVSSDTEGASYWFSSKPNVRTAIGIFSGTETPSNNTARAGGDIYIQY